VTKGVKRGAYAFVRRDGPTDRCRDQQGSVNEPWHPSL